MTEALIQKLDDPTRDSNDLLTTIQRMRSLRQRIIIGSSSPHIFSEDIRLIPTCGRLTDMLKEAAKKSAVKRAGLLAQDVLDQYHFVLPHMAAWMLDQFRTHRPPALPDLGGRFAQAVADMHLMPAVGQEPRLFLLAQLRTNIDEYVGLCEPYTFAYAYNHLRYLVEETGGIPYYQEKYSLHDDAREFLTEVLQYAEGHYAIQILNALEFSGYDCEDPDIIGDMLMKFTPALTKVPMLSLK